MNLVSKSTIPDVWGRHILDSAQLWRMRQGTRQWVDLGSGGGFPGLVLGILGRAEGHQVTLVESNQKKSSYLREAARVLELPVTVLTQRVEDLDLAKWPQPGTTVSARAFAPLGRILDWSKGLGGPEKRALFHKGRGYAVEIAEARDVWQFDLIEHPSLIDADSVILDITAVRKR